MKGPLHSIIVPVYQSRPLLETLVKRVSEVMNGAGIRFELILVDDGSQDDSFVEIKRLSSTYPFIRGFRLSRNFGKEAALTIGLQKCRGKYIGIIDDDLQDPPDVLLLLFEHLYKGVDVVYGVRKKRQENIFKRAMYAAFYRIINVVSIINIPNDTGDFCTMRRRVAEAILQLPDANPFLRATRTWVGFKQVGIEYERDARLEGKSGFTLSKYFKFAITGILLFSHIPLRLATYIGLMTSILSIGYASYIFWAWLTKSIPVPGYASTIMTITLLGGIQLITIGIIGQYIGYLMESNRKWPVAFIAEATADDEYVEELST